MKTRTGILGLAILAGFSAAASAQRVSWSVTFGTGPQFVAEPSRLMFVRTPALPATFACDRFAGYGPRYGRVPPPPVFRRTHVSYRPGHRSPRDFRAPPAPSRRIMYPFGGHPGVIQEWCPRRRAWISVGMVTVRQ